MSNEIKYAYAIVRNIPAAYHSAHLRTFFTHFIEADYFECFHFKHMPERIVSEKTRETESDHERSDVIDSILSATSENEAESSATVQRKTTCCIVKLAESHISRFLACYDGRQWLNAKGDSMKSVCSISKIKLSDANHGEKSSTASKSFLTKAELRQQGKHQVAERDLKMLPELNPPSVMPHGNVGTSTELFLDLIRACKLPATVIGKLGLKFPKSLGKRKYSSVPFQYSRTRTAGVEGSAGTSCARDSMKPSIEAEDISLAHDAIRQSFDTEDKDHKEPETNTNREDSEGDDDEDDDGGEEWDRVEALQDDAAERERNKERLFEEELEIVWEKGGPGIVWYTDAAYWHEQDGDFDEQTADDWDVDMAVYYDPEAGDKDARDFIDKRLTDRRRQGRDDADRLLPDKLGPIGSFEKHTKGLGRRLMEKQGWSDGRGLGSKLGGLADTISSDGQKPYDKRGLGYFGEKINRYGQVAAAPRRQPDDADTVSISTVYDTRPHPKDAPDSLLRRGDSHLMKYRKIDDSAETSEHIE